MKARHLLNELLLSWFDVKYSGESKFFILHCVHTTAWKNEEFALTRKYFVKSTTYLETGTGFLNRRHFDFYHGDAPCFKFDILNLNFPPLLVEKCKNVFFAGCQNSNPGPSSCQPSMLPLDQRGFNTWLCRVVYLYLCGGKFKFRMSNLKQGASPW